jgi:hypothetical protein
MADTYFDMTGVLGLERITPVIQALFGPFELDGEYPGGGEAYIARIAHQTSASWEAVRENLEGLATGLLGLDLDMLDEPPRVEHLIQALAEHFGANGNEQLSNLVAHGSFEDEADLDALFVIAQAFNDGHGLRFIKSESSWHCSRPKLFEFGGAGCFIGRHASVFGNSTEIAEFGQELDQALAGGDTAEAASVLRKRLGDTLAGIACANARAAVQSTLAVLLA